jgi:hypothetical protein
MAALAHEFLLLGSNRYHRLLLLLQGLGPAVDVLELRLPIRVRAALHGLAVGLETLAQVMEQAVDRPLTHRMPLRLEGRGQRGGTLACPPQERHRVATGHRIDQVSKARTRYRAWVCRGWRPPPGRRTCATGACGAAGETGWASSCQPARMVARDSPGASATWLIPPRPMARASTAAQRRRARSSKRGFRIANFAAIAGVIGLCIAPSIPL